MKNKALVLTLVLMLSFGVFISVMSITTRLAHADGADGTIYNPNPCGAYPLPACNPPPTPPTPTPPPIDVGPVQSCDPYECNPNAGDYCGGSMCMPPFLQMDW